MIGQSISPPPPPTKTTTTKHITKHALFTSSYLPIYLDPTNAMLDTDGKLLEVGHVALPALIRCVHPTTAASCERERRAAFGCVAVVGNYVLQRVGDSAGLPRRG